MLAGVDLHCHSTASDGTFAPAEVVRAAAEAGVSAIALTDHDTIAGVAEARAEAERLGIDFLSGIEISAAHPRPGTMHLLAYGFDEQHPQVRKLSAILAAAREERAERILAALRAAGVEIAMADVLAEGGTGRPHFAGALIRRGYAIATREAFDRYLGGGGIAYVENNPLAAQQIIPMIRAAGGIVSLAHPFQLRRQTFAQLEAMVRELAEIGMDALETLHGSHDTEMVHRLTRLADRLELIATGGSDFHGANKPWIRLGQSANRRPVPRAVYDAILALLGSRTSAAPLAA